MTFLNATLILGVTAVAIPIVLHLLAKKEPRKVVFPSVRFLTRRFETNRSRLLVRRWWLLAMRIAALAALAIALARPAIHQSLSITWLTIGMLVAAGVALVVLASVMILRGGTTPTAYSLVTAASVAILAAVAWGTYTYASGPAPLAQQGQPAAVAIVLDNSPTSAWQTSRDDRITRMKDLATWLVTRLPRSSRIAVVDRSAQVSTFSLDVASAVSKIEQIRPREVTRPIASRIDAAARLVRSSDLTHRHVLVITDLSDSSWDGSVADAGLGATFAQDPPVMLTVCDLGEFSGMNRSIDVPKISDPTPPRGVPVSLSTTARVTGSPPDTPVSVTAELQLYESDAALPVVRDSVIVRPKLQSVDRTSVQILPDKSAECLLTIPSLETGTHHGLLRLVGDDAMPLDDVRYFTIEVLESSQVLLVGDQEDEAEVIRQTVIASPGLIDEADAEFVVERIGFDDLAVVRLSDFDAMVLLDPPADVLRDESVSQFIRQGGGVLVALGPSAGEGPLAETWTPKPLRRWRAPRPGTFFQMSSSHPVTENLVDDTPWSSFRVHQYWQLEAEPNDLVLARFAGTSHPALIQRVVTDRAAPKESGRVLVLATPLPSLAPATAAWNDLFATDPWPSWLMTRQCVEYLTRRGSRQTMTTLGQPHVIRWESDDAVAGEASGTGPTAAGPLGSAGGGGGGPDSDDRSPRRVQLFPPGDRSPVPLDIPPGSHSVAVSDVSRSGTYWLRGASPGIGFSANLPQTAVRTDRVSADQLDQWLTPADYRLVSDRAGIELSQDASRTRVSLHSPALLLALLVFLFEQILANRFYRRRSATEQTSVLGQKIRQFAAGRAS